MPGLVNEAHVCGVADQMEQEAQAEQRIAAAVIGGAPSETTVHATLS